MSSLPAGLLVSNDNKVFVSEVLIVWTEVICVRDFGSSVACRTVDELFQGVRALLTF